MKQAEQPYLNTLPSLQPYTQKERIVFPQRMNQKQEFWFQNKMLQLAMSISQWMTQISFCALVHLNKHVPDMSCRICLEWK
jgi:hypothetical protein